MRLRFSTLLALALALCACPALSATLERLVMPGPVIEGHAEIEDDCAACHSPFDRSEQRGLCLDCHERVADDVAHGHGFHGLDDQASSAECDACHTEHLGRDADIIGLIPELFDHATTDFVLEGPHAETVCVSCHRDAPFHEAPGTCSDCHQDDDAHRGNLGDDCGACHVVGRWREARFDHDETDFILLGRHTETQCSACHIDQVYEATSDQCVDCHRVDDVHGGERGNGCGDCHAPSGWSDTEFDHQRQTGFALLGAHAELACKNCHPADMSLLEPPSDCVACHSSDDVHLGRNGSQCDSCHGTKEWSTDFDHVAETGFALLGAHGALQCEQCHVGAVTAKLPTDCAPCHRSDDPHEDSMPTCDACHSTSDWLEGLLFHHDLTGFPLVGLHRAASCEQCHDGLVFSRSANTCYDCHAGDDVHERSLGTECGGCHSEVGWEFWSFDHDAETRFALEGAHAGLECAGCHSPGDESLPERQCIGCHRQDDLHRGSFGRNCDDCHSQTTFAEPIID